MKLDKVWPLETKVGQHFKPNQRTFTAQKIALLFLSMQFSLLNCICSPLRLFNHYYKVDFSSNEKSSHEGNLRGASKILRADHTNFEALKKREEKRSPKGSYSLFLFWCQVIWIKEGGEANMFCCKNLVAKTTRLVLPPFILGTIFGESRWQIASITCSVINTQSMHVSDKHSCKWSPFSERKKEKW